MLLQHKSNGITPQKQCFYSVIPLFFILIRMCILRNEKVLDFQFDINSTPLSLS